MRGKPPASVFFVVLHILMKQVCGKGGRRMGRRGLFLKNAAVLTAATLALRLIGMVFRVVISNRLGAEGMGLYQIVVSVYTLASTLASAGISLAVTRLVSEEQIRTRRDGMKKLMGFCIGVSAALGSVMAVVLYAAAGILAAGWIGEPDTAASLRVLSLSLPFMAVSAALRGYFTARRRIAFSSVAQLLEQGVKFAACMAFITLWGINSTTFGCFLVMAADTLSEWFSFAFQYVGYRADARRLPEKGQPLPRTPPLAVRLFEIAAPVAGVRIVGSVLYTVENTLVPNLLEEFLTGSLEVGAAHSGALAQWGQLKGMGIPVLMFPSTLLAAFVLLLVPELSELRARNDRSRSEQVVGLALHITLAAAIGIAAGLYLLAPELCEAIYPGQGIGFYVRVLAPLVPFIYLENVAEGMLKGLGEQKITLKYSFINVAVRLGLIAVLVPRAGMPGFLWMMLADNVVTALLHANRVLTVMEMRTDWVRWVLRPLAAAAVVYLGGTFTRTRLLAAGWDGLWVALGVGAGMAVVYLGLLVVLRCFTAEQLHILLNRGKNGKKA